ncbi:MAG: hypothetical protein ACJ763_06540 [Bdellovibrionia bacterium]
MTRFSIAALCLCLGLWFAHLEPPATASDDMALEKVLALLESSPTGKSMIEKAMRVWNLHSRDELHSRIKWGSASKTDAVLIRHYDAETGKEVRERKVTIYLRHDQPSTDLMLDLAHELVHATSKPSWDPYDPMLTAGGYIHAAIDGEGGEVDAVRVECQVSHEIFGDRSSSPSAARCKHYSLLDQKAATEMIRKDFYRVGRWMKDLKQQLGSETGLFPYLSKERPSLYSSTGGAPYPVALYQEYRQMTAVACENTRRRAPASAPERSPKRSPERSNERSDLAEADLAHESSVRLFLAHRCR